MTFTFNQPQDRWEMRDRGGRVLFTVSKPSEDDVRFWQQWAAKQRAEGR